MQRLEWQYTSADARSTITAVVYAPEGEAKGIVQVCHGMSEKISRYEECMTFWASHGFVACGHDHIGHGRSAYSEQERGYFGEKNGARVLVEDALALELRVREAYPDLPCVLLGHSMGSFVVRLLMERYPGAVDGVILSGTGGPNPAANMGIAIAKLTSRLRGGHYRSRMISHMAFGSYTRRIPKRRTPKDWLTRDEAIVDAYRSDPDCSFIFTARGFETLFSLVKTVNRHAWYRAVNPDTPVLLMSGAMDPVGGYGKGVTTVYDRLRKAGVKEVTLRLYPEGRHEMLNELNRQDVYADVLHFLEARV